jgi:glycerate dehydrogenase
MTILTPTPKIVVLDGFTLSPGDNSWDSIARLGALSVFERSTPAEAIQRSASANILITNKAPITEALLAAAPAVRFIAVTATGFNVVDVPAAQKRGISVSNVPIYGTNTVAQFTFALILELCHRVGQHSASVFNGEWQRSRDWCYWLTPQIELAGKTIGIAGFGRIGRRVGELAHAFGMKVLANSTTMSREPGYEPFAWVDLPTIFSESDVVTLHCPQTERNKQMVNDSLLSRMKKSALLINASRGGLVNEADLAAHLNRGTLAGAAVDVVSAEPIGPDNPLLGARNCIITPHMAWTTLDARKRILVTTAQNIEAFLSGAPVNVVNLPVG